MLALKQERKSSAEERTEVHRCIYVAPTQKLLCSSVLDAYEAFHVLVMRVRACQLMVTWQGDDEKVKMQGCCFVCLQRATIWGN